MNSRRTDLSISYLSSTEQKPRYHQAGKVLRTDHAAKNDSPGEDQNTYKFANAEFDKCQRNQRLADKLCHVYNGTSPGIFLRGNQLG